MVVETTGNYSIVLPVMISNTIAYLISRKYQDVSLFDVLARQDDLELPSMEEQREQVVLRVEDAMRKPDRPSLQASDTLARASRVGRGFSRRSPAGSISDGPLGQHHQAGIARQGPGAPIGNTVTRGTLHQPSSRSPSRPASRRRPALHSRARSFARGQPGRFAKAGGGHLSAGYPERLSKAVLMMA